MTQDTHVSANINYNIQHRKCDDGVNDVTCVCVRGPASFSTDKLEVKFVVYIAVLCLIFRIILIINRFPGKDKKREVEFVGEGLKRS